MAPSKNLRKGISLIEIIIAVAFLVFGLGAVMDMYMSEAKGAERVARLQAVTAAAQSGLAELQAAGYSALDARIGTAAKEVSLFEKPVPAPTANVFWNATLKKEQKDGVNCIRIAVSGAWDASSAKPADKAEKKDISKSLNIRKEVVGYVAAP